MEITIALGSNTKQELHIEEAFERLKAVFPDITFTQPQWTEPVGIVSDKYLKLYCAFHHFVIVRTTCAAAKEY